MIKLIVLLDQAKLVSQIDEVTSELGEPDCKLTEPFLLKEDGTLTPWLVDVTNENVFMITSDKILTLTDPKPTLLEKYEKLLKPILHAPPTLPTEVS